ncbi:MAG: hypothetical protein ABSG96_27495, partial [Terracidiphilus sp.]
ALALIALNQAALIARLAAHRAWRARRPGTSVAGHLVFEPAVARHLKREMAPARERALVSWWAPAAAAARLAEAAARLRPATGSRRSTRSP